MITKIVVALDGSRLAEQVLPYVTQIGRMTGAKVVLMTSITPVTLWEPSRLLHLLDGEEEAATRYLENQRLFLAKHGIDASIYVDVGRPASRIVKLAADRGADLIAMTTHGRSGIARLWLGSIATGVLHQSHLPLLLVRSTEEPGAAAIPIRRIYVPDDGSELAASARPFISEFARALGASVVLHRVIESFSPIILPSAQAAGGYDRLLDAVKAATIDTLSEEAGSFERAGVETQVMVTKGHVPDELLHAADEVDASLIAMSTHGRSAADRIVLPSAADAVVRRSELPCLLVRPPAVRHRMEAGASDNSTSGDEDDR
jgi:nucleotide-binding universal stress UspA family protein